MIRGATTSGAGSPKPEGEAAEVEASTPGKESGRGFCEIQWPWWRGSTDSASKSSKSKVFNKNNNILWFFFHFEHFNNGFLVSGISKRQG